MAGDDRFAPHRMAEVVGEDSRLHDRHMVDVAAQDDSDWHPCHLVLGRRRDAEALDVRDRTFYALQAYMEVEERIIRGVAPRCLVPLLGLETGVALDSTRVSANEWTHGPAGPGGLAWAAEMTFGPLRLFHAGAGAA